MTNFRPIKYGALNNGIICFLELYSGAKAFPKSLIRYLGAPDISPDKLIKSEVLVNKGIDRCKSLTANAVDCPPGWSITDGKIFDSDSGKGSFYCFKNAGLSYGWDDLCQSGEFRKEGARRITASELGSKQHF